jgi:hypothetical protein
MPYLAMFIIMLLMKSGALKRADKSVLATIYIATSIVAIYTTYKGFYSKFAGLSHARLENQDIHGWAMPSFWMPSTDALRRMMFPGAYIDWSEWGPVVLFWSIYPIVFSFLVYSWTLLFRRLWVDVQVMPFPHAQGWIVAQLSLKETNGKKMKVFLVATLLTFIFFIPFIIVAAYPPFPDIYGWLKNPNFVSWDPGAFFLTDAFPILRSTIVGPLVLNTNPVYYALTFLAPLDVLLTAGISWLAIFIILPQALYSVGYYSGLLAAGSIWDKFGGIGQTDPLKPYAFSAMGLMPGILIMQIFINRRYFSRSLKLAFGKIGDITPEETEEAPIYRLAYLLMPIAILSSLAIFIASGIEPLVSIIMVLVIFILTIGGLALPHVYSVIGIQASPWDGVGIHGYLKPFWGQTLESGKLTQSQLMAGTLGNWVISTSDDAFGNTFGPAVFSLDSFKVASVVGFKATDAFKLIATATVIAGLIAPITHVLGMHYFGFAAIPASKEWDFMWCGDAGAYNNLPAQDPWWPQALAGLIAAFALSYLRARFAWFWFDPIGLMIVTCGWNASWMGVGSMMLITWVIKFIVIKVGGRRIYEEYSIPAVFGVVVGYTLGVMIAAIAALLRWYFPL